MPSGPELLLVLSAYAVGCVNAGYYLVRWRTGRDLRSAYSGNAGATNAGRVLGRAGFAVVFLLDFAKGAAALGAALWLPAGEIGLAGAMIAVVAGHVWPVQLGLRGGKGVSTALGALAVYDPMLLAALIGAFLFIYACLRRFSLSGIFAFALAPAVAYFLDVAPFRIGAASVVAAIVVFAHRGDLREELVRGFRTGAAGEDDHGG